MLQLIVSLKRKSVVLLDDDPETLDLFAFVLAQAGYEVRTASHGHEFLRLLSDEIPSAVVMDLGLPDARGIALCRTVRNWRQCTRLPIIAVTGWSSGPYVEGLEDAAFNEVFLKPVEPPKLVEALKRWVAVSDAELVS